MQFMLSKISDYFGKRAQSADDYFDEVESPPENDTEQKDAHPSQLSMENGLELDKAADFFEDDDEDDDGNEESGSEDEEGDPGFKLYTDPEMDSYAYEYALLQPDEYLIRHISSDSIHVLAERNRPVVKFCVWLYKYETKAISELHEKAPLSLAEHSQDGRFLDVPGVLTFFVENCLNDEPVFAFVDDDGTTRLVDSEQATPLAAGENANADYIVNIGPSKLLSYHDTLFDAKMQSINDTRSTRALIDTIDKNIATGHLRQFERTGDTAGRHGTNQPGWSGQSPVTKRSSKRWFVINRHYYSLWQAYDNMCRRSGVLLRQLKIAADTGSIGEVGALRTHAGGKSDADQKAANSDLELRVVEKIVAYEKSLMEREHEINQLYNSLETLSSRVVGLRHAINNLNLQKKTIISSFGGSDSDSETIGTVSELLDKMDTTLCEINKKKLQRF